MSAIFSAYQRMSPHPRQMRITSLRWARQSSKYRRDDVDVTARGEDKFNIVERLDGPEGALWVHTHKLCVLVEGQPIGVLFISEMISQKDAMHHMRGKN